MNAPSTDYHDYVFRDGRLVGDFEGMYRHSTEAPWHQDEQAGWLDVRLTLELLRDFPQFSTLRDYGSGLGHYLSILQASGLFASPSATGFDISATACQRAQASFPQHRFLSLDLTVPNATDNPACASGGRELHVIRGTLWYVCGALDTVIHNLRHPMKDSDLLLVVQNFPPLQSSFVGKDVLPDHHALIGRLSGSFSLIRHLWLEDGLRNRNDNWFIGLFSPMVK